MKSTFSAVLTTLEEIAEGSGSDRVVEARGLLFQVNSFQFLLSLLLFERIFSITAKLSDLLQAMQQQQHASRLQKRLYKVYEGKQSG